MGQASRSLPRGMSALYHLRKAHPAQDVIISRSDRVRVPRFNVLSRKVKIAISVFCTITPVFRFTVSPVPWIGDCDAEQFDFLENSCCQRIQTEVEPDGLPNRKQPH